METELTNSITNRQMVFILLLSLVSLGMIDISRAMAVTAGTGAWFTLLIATVFFSLSGVIVIALNSRFPGKMLFDYSGEIAGKFVSYVLAIYYILYFLFILVTTIPQLAKLVQYDFLPRTPRWATMLILIPVLGFTAYKGITNVARIAEYMGLIFIITGITVQTLMATQSRLNNILPLFDTSKIGNYLGALKDTIVPFLGIEVLLVIPMTKENGGKKALRTAFFAVLGVGLLYIYTVEGCFMRLGIHDIAHYNDSLIVAIRSTEVPFFDFLQRLDILYLTVGFMGLFVGLSVFYTAMVEYICRIFQKAGRLLIVILSGMLTFIVCIWADGIKEFNLLTKDASVYLGMAAIFIIPCVLLLIAKVKKNGQKTN